MCIADRRNVEKTDGDAIRRKESRKRFASRNLSYLRPEFTVSFAENYRLSIPCSLAAHDPHNVVCERITETRTISRVFDVPRYRQVLTFVIQIALSHLRPRKNVIDGRNMDHPIHLRFVKMHDPSRSFPLGGPSRFITNICDAIARAILALEQARIFLTRGKMRERIFYDNNKRRRKREGDKEVTRQSKKETREE